MACWWLGGVSFVSEFEWVLGVMVKCVNLKILEKCGILNGILRRKIMLVLMAP